jgi:hypothetical protein
MRPRTLAYLLAITLTASIASDLFRMPIQVSDSLGETVWFAKTQSLATTVDPVTDHARGSLMLTAFVVLLRSPGLICRGHRAVALENLALR